MRMRTPLVAGAAAALGLGLALVPAASAGAAPQDTACLRAGLRTLQSAGLLDDVARGGLPIATAVALGVTPRAGTDVASLPDPLPLRVVLADHRAGDDSLFVYPWCG
jgi:hypothetical protein